MAGTTRTRSRERRSSLERARDAYRRRAWAAAHAAFARAERKEPLAAGDLEAFALSAYMLGRDEDYLGTLERAHHAHLERGDALPAARCAFWIGLRQALRGEKAPATGWFGRAERLVAGERRECVERGYLRLPVAEQHLRTGNDDAAYATAAEAAAIGEQFREPDLLAIARHQQGWARLQQGRVQEGLALLDEVMVAVSAGELSALTTGLMYCSVVQACQTVYALERARQWTSALSRWCDEQPEMLAFTGACRVHRAELLELGGSWDDALEEARRACAPGADVEASASAAALYQQGEVHRLRGDLALAEQAYRNASRAGFDPQPGLALLLLARGDVQAAANAARRVLTTNTDRAQRTRILPACIEVLLAAGEIEEPRKACVELEESAGRLDSEMLHAMAAHARGAVQLAEGSAQSAVLSLRRASQLWQRIGAPYASARTRVLVGLACRELGDRAGARFEFDAAKAAFRQLGAIPDLTRVEALTEQPPAARTHGLTERELEVLRLVASGKSNKAIAAALCLSEKTIERHVSNVFARLGVASRSAATAYAYEHRLI